MNVYINILKPEKNQKFINFGFAFNEPNLAIS